MSLTQLYMEDRLEIIKKGSLMFEELFNEYPSKSTSDISDAEEILRKLLEKTKGFVIVDFMDFGNWDCFGSVKVDKENNLLNLYWHLYDGSNDINTQITQTEYKPTYHSIMLNFKELKMVNLKNFPFITIRGYAHKNRETLKLLKSQNIDASQLKDDLANFYTLYQIDKKNHFELCYSLDTPIYSVVITPKNTAGSTDLSNKVLFTYNYFTSNIRLQKILDSIGKIDLDEDEICEKANTIRRVFEFVLKVECSYFKENTFKHFYNDKEISDERFLFKKDYSDVLLGDLVSILKPVKNEEQKKQLNRIVIYSNELSHDSGKKVTIEKLKDLLYETTLYLKEAYEMVGL